METPMTTASKTGLPSESKPQNFDQSSKSGHAIRDAATALGQGAEDLASSITSKADDVAAATGRKIESVADQIRSHTPDSGILGTASNKLADSLEYGGMYLKDQGVSGMTADVTKLIRSNPITSLIVGVGVGILLARATTCRNS